MARAFKPQIATGNDLLEGDAVYFTAHGGWSRDIRDAALALDAEAAEAMLSRAAKDANEIVGIYLADAALDGNGCAAPAHFREAFRMRGPSNHPGHGKQAELADV